MFGWDIASCRVNLLETLLISIHELVLRELLGRLPIHDQIPYNDLQASTMW